MVKLTAVKIGKLINRSPKYVYTLLHRKGISISDIDFEKLIDLIMQYRWRRWNVNGKKKTYCKGTAKSTAIDKYDKLFTKLYEECKEKYHNVCADCGKVGYWMVIHHIDGNHGNMVAENLVYLCTPCHWSRHTGHSAMGYWKNKARGKPDVSNFKGKNELTT